MLRPLMVGRSPKRKHAAARRSSVRYSGGTVSEHIGMTAGQRSDSHASSAGAPRLGRQSTDRRRPSDREASTASSALEDLRHRNAVHMEVIFFGAIVRY